MTKQEVQNLRSATQAPRDPSVHARTHAHTRRQTLARRRDETEPHNGSEGTSEDENKGKTRKGEWSRPAQDKSATDNGGEGSQPHEDQGRGGASRPP